MKTAVCLLVVQFGNVLSISRRGDTTAWGMPGGKVEELETNVEAIIREVKEEIGVNAPAIAYEPLFVDHCPGEDDYWVTTYLWVDTPLRDHELDPEKGFELKWLSREQLENAAVSPFAGYNAKVFEAYDKFTAGTGFIGACSV